MQFDTITISSKDRNFGDKSKFELIVNTPLISGKYRLKEAKFTHTFYTFRGDTVIFDDGLASPVVLTGNFSAASLAAEIDSQLPAGYVITYDPNLQRLVFTNAAPFTITFPSLYVASAFGFPSATTLVVSSGLALSITATDPPEMNRYQNIFIQIQEFGSTGTTNKVAYTYVIPVNADRDELIIYVNHDFDQVMHTNTNNNQKVLHITVLGDDGIQIPSTEMAEWSIIISTIMNVN